MSACGILSGGEPEIRHRIEIHGALNGGTYFGGSYMYSLTPSFLFGAQVNSLVAGDPCLADNGINPGLRFAFLLTDFPLGVSATFFLKDIRVGLYLSNLLMDISVIPRSGGFPENLVYYFTLGYSVPVESTLRLISGNGPETPATGSNDAGVPAGDSSGVGRFRFELGVNCYGNPLFLIKPYPQSVIDGDNHHSAPTTGLGAMLSLCFPGTFKLHAGLGGGYFDTYFFLGAGQEFRMNERIGLEYAVLPFFAGDDGGSFGVIPSGRFSFYLFDWLKAFVSAGAEIRYHSNAFYFGLPLQGGITLTI